MGPEHAALQHEGGHAGADELGGDLRREVQGQGHGARTTRSRSPTPRCTCRRRSRASASPTRTSSPRSSSTRRWTLLKQQRPLIKKYWALASDEIDLFKNGDAVIGASWPYQTITLQDDKAPVKDTDPGARARRAGPTRGCCRRTRKHPNCAYQWMKYVSTPKVQAQQAIYFGETPANTQGLPDHGRDPEGLLRAVPRQRAGVVLRLDQVLEDAGARTAATARRTAPTTRPGSRSGLRSRGRRWSVGPPGAARPASARRRLCSAGRGCGPPAAAQRPAAWFVLIYLARAGRAVRLGVLERRLVHRASSSTTGRSTTSGRSSTTRPTARSRCARSGSRRR